MSVSPIKGAVRAAGVSDDAAQHPDNGHEEVVSKQAGTSGEAVAPAAKVVAKPAKKRSPVLPVILLGILAGGGYFGYNWWTEGRFMVETDDAYIAGDIATISPKVTGYVKTVLIANNQRVKAGDVMVTLDDGDYRIALEQAQSQLATQKLTVDRMAAQVIGGEAAVQQAQAQLLAAQATLHSAELTFKRVTDLRAQSVMSQAELDTATSALETGKANVAAAVAAVASANANISVLKAQKAEAEAGVKTEELAVAQAQRNLDFTILRAPYDGVIGNLGVQEGNLVSSGARLASLVPVDKLYIDANFKETQISDIVPGSKVKLHVDAYGKTPIEGTVVSLAAGSGSVFSMLPPENATGNFTKIIQRVPVRIAIPQDVLDKGFLKAGLSVVVEVDTRTAPKEDGVK
ncbi:HlyD family secretion protein [Rhizobium oryziradicis]|uniref:Hemolysin D n=1 Tax=Rhizobium oryziradicis TaxID=1867956 RepID=A0A1Q8ZX82_9HYPH|nr:HlyD family secretion protein [Rhizobium oryziradicis]OLP46660.1 hemolysin D [Rhizobium oryziradicis]